MKETQGSAHALFERGVGHALAEGRGTTRLTGVESELTEPGDDVSVAGPRRCDCVFARPDLRRCGRLVARAG
jgi:hypothetical protein